MRRSVGLALLLGILCAPPARAQDQAAPGGRPWSDPPTKPAEAPAPQEAARPTPPDTARVARPARAHVRQARAERPAVVRRKEVRSRVAQRPSRRFVPEAPATRAAALRPPAVRPVRYARPLPSPDMRGYGDVDLWVDARADRIRRGRDGGFLVMRRTTFEDPMGRRMQILRPLEDEDE
ncbi:hypothetical protein VQ02_17155 [Methylobacterium variabile]|uniref:Uncharacterized protein n=2 Tax=Methylobacterium variabile TaxID=298794 RepID=A0A0J6SPT1_9HYPH|nr:hypothetical protein VQ02_17155 [Methylobacterium variabile]